MSEEGVSEETTRAVGEEIMIRTAELDSRTKRARAVVGGLVCRLGFKIFPPEVRDVLE